MRELILVELTGHTATFPLDESARDELAAYLRGSDERLVGDPDSGEIVADLERSIGDRLRTLLPGAGDRISLEQMRSVLAEVGSVGSGEAVPATAAGPTRGRFFCRIQQGKWFGGICAGIAAYGNFRVDWVRTVFILLGLFSGGLLIAVYLIALIPLPTVNTVADYERMRDAPR